MARYLKDLQVTRDMNQAINEAAAYLTSEGFKNVMFNGENVWKKGNGWMTGPQFIKLQTAPGVVRIEAWFKFAILPGVYGGEEGLDGFVGAVPKTFLRSRVNQVERIFQMPGYAAAPAGSGTPVCAKCGAAVQTGANFCESCGEKLG